jgi:hypothetical protein
MIELKKRKGTILISSMSLHIGKMENLWHNKANSWSGGQNIPRKYTESRERIGAPGSVLSRRKTEPTNVAY